MTRKSQEIVEHGKPIGRPSLRSPQIVDELIERQSHGEPLSSICADDHMPSFGTVWRWENNDDEFRELSTRARRIGTHYIAGDCIRISDSDTIEPANKRIMIDTRLRLIGKWNAKEFGEKLEVKSIGRTANMEIPAELDAQEAARRYQDFIAGE